MHPTDALWREFLDRESDPPTQRRLETHLDGCPICQEKAATVERERAFVAGLLDQLNGEVPSRSVAHVLGRPGHGAVRRQLTAAAVVALCVVAAAAGATIRTGVWQEVGDWLLGPRPWLQATPRDTSPVTMSDQAPASALSFDPGGDAEIVFAERQEQGEIDVVLDVGAKVSITASAPVAYLAGSRRVTVANRQSAASYLILLPRTLRRVRIRVGDQLIFLKQGTSVFTSVRPDSRGRYIVPFSHLPKSTP